MKREEIFNKFKGKKVLITGHTGFKGSWLVLIMKELGAEVHGFSIDEGQKSIYSVSKSLLATDTRGDINDYESIHRIIDKIRPHYLFHLAAQPIVKQSYEDPLTTFSTNAMGSLNILESLRILNLPCVCILVTSDKAYDNVEMLFGYRETDALGGKDPYSASKACAEIIFKSYFESFLKKGRGLFATARAGNVIGGGDWSKDRIVPDCIRSWRSGGSVHLRSPEATRPWQHVLEPLIGYVWLAMKLNDSPNTVNGESFNFGPVSGQNVNVFEIVNMLGNHFGGLTQITKELSRNNVYESGLLKLNIDKSLHLLNWYPTWNIDQTVINTASWYRDEVEDKAMLEVSQGQITEYISQFVHGDK